MRTLVSEPKIVVVVPAHLASVRFAEKILFPFAGHPMIEHVRRRALLANEIDDVYVATCDDEIADVVARYGGKVLMTGSHHYSGTTRVAEAIREIDCSHVILLQGDEPLLLPQYIEAMAEAIKLKPNGNAWNCVAPIVSADELDRHSFVKCVVGQTSCILNCFRRSPSFADLQNQKRYIFKVLGIIGYQKKFLEMLVDMPATPSEQADSIEQMRILEHGYSIEAVLVDKALPSVNEVYEADIINQQLENDPIQVEILNNIFFDQR